MEEDLKKNKEQVSIPCYLSYLEMKTSLEDIEYRQYKLEEYNSRMKKAENKQNQSLKNLVTYNPLTIISKRKNMKNLKGNKYTWNS
jgi:hypothetical protein